MSRLRPLHVAVTTVTCHEHSAFSALGQQCKSTAQLRISHVHLSIGSHLPCARLGPRGILPARTAPHALEPVHSHSRPCACRTASRLCAQRLTLNTVHPFHWSSSQCSNTPSEIRDLQSCEFGSSCLCSIAHLASICARNDCIFTVEFSAVARLMAAHMAMDSKLVAMSFHIPSRWVQN